MRRFDVHLHVNTAADLHADSLLDGAATAEPALAELLDGVRDLGRGTPPPPRAALTLMFEQGPAPVPSPVVRRAPQPHQRRRWIGRWSARVAAVTTPLALKLGVAAVAMAATGGLAAAGGLPPPLQRLASDTAALLRVDIPRGDRAGEAPAGQEQKAATPPEPAGGSGDVSDGWGPGDLRGDRSGRHGSGDRGGADDGRRAGSGDRGAGDPGTAQRDRGGTGGGGSAGVPVIGTGAEQRRRSSSDADDADDRAEDAADEAEDRADDEADDAEGRGDEAADDADDVGDEAEERADDAEDAADDAGDRSDGADTDDAAPERSAPDAAREADDSADEGAELDD